MSHRLGFQGEHPFSQREFWLEAFLAALHRTTSEQALVEADNALEVCNARWSNEVRFPVHAYLSSTQVGDS
jgi:hypothetical protein